MDIFLVRHGEASASWGESPDPGLSVLGMQQAESAAATLMAHMHRQTQTQLWSSPLRRAVETAQPLAKVMRQRVLEHDVYREIPSPVPLEQRQAWLRQFMQQKWHEQGAELLAWRAAMQRHLSWLRTPAVIFTHFLVINAVVGRLLDQDETLCFWPANGSITHLRRNGAGLELISLGEEMQTRVS